VLQVRNLVVDPNLCYTLHLTNGVAKVKAAHDQVTIGLGNDTLIDNFL